MAWSRYVLLKMMCVLTVAVPASFWHLSSINCRTSDGRGEDLKCGWRAGNRSRHCNYSLTFLNTHSYCPAFKSNPVWPHCISVHSFITCVIFGLIELLRLFKRSQRRLKACSSGVLQVCGKESPQQGKFPSASSLPWVLQSPLCLSLTWWTSL